MVYSFQLWRHPNIHYREAILRLSVCELFAMLRSLSITAEIQAETLGSASFLTFECRPLSPEELTWLRGHSCVVFMAEKRGSMLFPLAVDPPDAVFAALPEVLKYKGPDCQKLLTVLPVGQQPEPTEITIQVVHQEVLYF